jgi:hypothetical protein
MINLNPAALRVHAWEDTNEWGLRRIRMQQYRLPGRGRTASTTPLSDSLAIAGVTATGATRYRDHPAEIASPLAFLAPDESPQLVHDSGHAARSERTNFVLPPSRLRGAEQVQAQRAQFMASSEASN